MANKRIKTTKTNPTKASSGNPKQTTTGKNWFSSKKLTVLVIVIALVVGFLAYNQLQSYLEKRQFEAANEQLEGLTTTLEVGDSKPESISSLKSCRYTSAKFEKGYLSCGVGWYLVYQAPNSETQNNIINKIQQVIFSQTDTGSQKDINFPMSDRDQRFNENVQLFNAKSSSMGCSAKYSTNYEGWPQQINVSQQDQGLYISFYCSSGAKAEHYPVVKQ